MKLTSVLLALLALNVSLNGSTPLSIKWIEWNPEIYQTERKEKDILVAVEASWDMSCIYNRDNVFKDKEVIERINMSDTLCLRIDMTEEYKQIELAGIQAHVPRYIFLRANTEDPVLFEGVIRKEELLKTIKHNQAAHTTPPIATR